ncbi:uncharacterized protein LOC112349885 [Selaginella moellendorffii]|uniref:uncharacterized protein LOC112349885 n=1 Tax=Selaginella moellendorffii TaxID=88036 RepID=UPI000D1C58D8|nr:uncharacterized protein LOC112349885 [Selaginella moellendorffii]|eukprot:XP_024540837.1 uncharacterized protein LOC112349885 [Selaginella moellendorffii]
MSTVHLFLLLLLLFVQSPVPLQAEHKIFDRGAGTSFSSATVTNRSRCKCASQLDPAITCADNSQESSSTTSVEQQQEPPELASFLQYASPTQQECQVLALEEQRNDNAAVVSRSLEFNQQALFSPSIKFLTILNTDNSSLDQHSSGYQHRPAVLYPSS